MDYLFKNADKVLELLVEHVSLVVLSLAISLCIAFPIAMLISKFTRAQVPVIGTFSIIYTIPSLALLAFLVPFFGLGMKTAMVSLILYSQMILVRNMVAGIKGIDPSINEAAKGMGMNKWRIFLKITVPLALPVFIAGIRIAAISMIGIATIAAFVNAGGLGKLIFEGIYQDHPGKIIAGSIAVVVLAIGTETALRLLERKTALK
ncbi:ABC transporter permease [Cohnella sp.]|uniref:ABC transporter permease n=1 Tax=Cohnella sp. TaxID=1883426 RepID=UPI003566DAAD